MNNNDRSIIDISNRKAGFAKGFNSSVQATRERLGQVAPEEITELPQGMCPYQPSESRPTLLAEYKDLETRVDVLRNIHTGLLRFE